MKTETETLIRDLAKSLGTTVEHVYEVMTKQAKAEIVKAAWRIMYMTGLSISMYFVTDLVEWIKLGEYESMQSGHFAYVIIWVIATVSWIETVIDIKQGVGNIIDCAMNPRYQALTNMLYYLSPYSED